jgi:3',5'-cyclic AMP phosphodiesterase CpdA
VKLLITADLHYGASRDGDRAVEALAERACGEGADALLIGGDIGEGPRAFEACLALFEGFRGAKLAVPGNHDVWVRRETVDSWTLHESVLPARLEDHGFHPLHLRPAKVGDVGFVGSMGWYDYSFRDDIGIDLTHYETKTFPGTRHPIWNDARFARFPMADGALAGLLADRLGRQLADLEGSGRVVALLHHVASKRLLYHPRCLVPRVWRFLNAFLGSESLGTVLGRDARVVQVFCGHIHRSRTVEFDGSSISTIGSSATHKELVRATPTEILDRELLGPQA